jgi:DNA-binding protein HU-beta
MNKEEVIAAMATETGMSKVDAKRALDSFINTVKKAVKKKDSVNLVGFMSIAVAKRAERQGRDPRTGKPMQIAAKMVVKLKVGKELQESVSQK